MYKLPRSCIGTSHVHSLNEFLPVYFQTVIGGDKLYFFCTASDQISFSLLLYSHHVSFAKFILIFWRKILAYFADFWFVFILFCCFVFYFCLVVVSFLIGLFC